MARLQILELPAEHHGDDMVTPFVLVVDQCAPQRYAVGAGMEPVDPWDEVAKKIGARGVIVMPDTVELPANGALTDVDDAGRAGTTQIVYAHERTRLELCAALMLSGDTTWHQLVEQVGERQRGAARVLRLPERPETMTVNPEQPYAYIEGYAAGIRDAKQAAGGGV